MLTGAEPNLISDWNRVLALPSLATGLIYHLANAQKLTWDCIHQDELSATNSCDILIRGVGQ